MTIVLVDSGFASGAGSTEGSFADIGFGLTLNSNSTPMQAESSEDRVSSEIDDADQKDWKEDEN